MQALGCLMGALFRWRRPFLLCPHMTESNSLLVGPWALVESLELYPQGLSISQHHHRGEEGSTMIFFLGGGTHNESLAYTLMIRQTSTSWYFLKIRSFTSLPDTMQHHNGGSYYRFLFIHFHFSPIDVSVEHYLLDKLCHALGWRVCSYRFKECLQIIKRSN